MTDEKPKRKFGIGNRVNPKPERGYNPVMTASATMSDETPASVAVPIPNPATVSAIEPAPAAPVSPTAEPVVAPAKPSIGNGVFEATRPLRNLISVRRGKGELSDNDKATYARAVNISPKVRCFITVPINEDGSTPPEPAPGESPKTYLSSVPGAAPHTRPPSANKRVILRELKVKTSMDTFFWAGHGFHLDTEKILFFAKCPIIVFDRDYFEPLDAKYVLAGLEPHFSARADHILRLGFVRQTVGALHGQATGMDWKIAIIIGAIIGYAVCTVISPATASHVAATVKP